LWLAGDEELAYALERKLFDRGCLVHVLAGEGIVDAAKASADTGLISICAVPEEDVATRDAVQRAVGSDRFLAVNRGELPAGPDEAADALCRTLEDRAYIPRLPKPFTGGAGI
jgi:adenylylsulfate kinase-like enzyme